jgi:protein kinase X
VFHRRLRPPLLPRVAHDGDVNNYDEYPEVDWKRTPIVTERELRLFDDF